jgi:exodeoxyribonuclease VII large subunit
MAAMTTPNQPPRPSHNLPEYTVSELSNALKRTVEDTYAHVRVRGEVSGFKRHGSGHLYLCLKDADAVLDAVCWRGQAVRLGVAPEDGLEVICTGRLTTYPGRSKYQLVIDSMELAGEGALLKLLEDRKRRLAAEGLFDPARKKPIPFLPAVIGVVTSPTGAVIRDILHRLADRFPRHVLLWPVAVQGEGAAEQVAAAIQGFNAIIPGGAVPRPDLLIVARGGGSLEDLWAFNEEVVVRAAAASDIPLISAVGHETDTTLIDFAADLRAPTPTGAAEKAVPVRLELLSQVQAQGSRLVGCMTRKLDERRTHVRNLARALPNPRRVIEEAAQRLDDRAERLGNSLPTLLHKRETELANAAGGLRHALRAFRAEVTRGAADLAQRQERLASAVRRHLSDRDAALGRCADLLRSYSYERVLERGFALVEGKAGPVTHAAGAEAGEAWTVRFQDGAVAVTVGGVARPPHKPRKPGSDDKQGDLF